MFSEEMICSLNDLELEVYKLVSEGHPLQRRRPLSVFLRFINAKSRPAGTGSSGLRGGFCCVRCAVWPVSMAATSRFIRITPSARST